MRLSNVKFKINVLKEFSLSFDKTRKIFCLLIRHYEISEKNKLVYFAVVS